MTRDPIRSRFHVEQANRRGKDASRQYAETQIIALRESIKKLLRSIAIKERQGAWEAAANLCVHVADKRGKLMAECAKLANIQAVIDGPAEPRQTKPKIGSMTKRKASKAVFDVAAKSSYASKVWSR